VADEHRSIIWIDAGGRTRQTILHSQGSSAAVEAALATKSNAGVQMDWAGVTSSFVPTPVATPYPAVTDTAQLTFEDGGGLLVYVTLPAPDASIFQTDGETVDPAQIAGIVAAVVGTLCSQSGALVVSYVGGVRRKAAREYQ
jgi:hypothetical protein